MYTIIGGDGKEYGPVTAEQVRSWIAGGRANLATKVRPAGSDAWKTIEECPEITGTGPSPTGAPPQVPIVGAIKFREVANLDVISCYERSWKLLKANFWPLIGATFVMTCLVAVLMYAQYNGVMALTSVFGAALSAGLYYFFLRKVRGLPTTFKDLFAGFTRGFVTLVVTGILITVFFTVGVICLVIPGIYLLVAYTFTNILVVDKRLGFWEAMEGSRKVITKQWFRMLGLILLGIPFVLLGLAAFLIGIFVAIPLITGAVVYAYEDLCNPQGTVTPSGP